MESSSLIMKRPGVLENYKRADCIEQILFQNQIPLIPALKFRKSLQINPDIF